MISRLLNFVTSENRFTHQRLSFLPSALHIDIACVSTFNFHSCSPLTSSIYWQSFFVVPGWSLFSCSQGVSFPPSPQFKKPRKAVIGPRETP
eukprot:scaffold30447_cov160-Skeletonema_menzelii.AAC.2